MDCVVSLASEWVIPACLEWHESTVVLPPVDWKCGGVHAPEVVERWQSMPGCSARAKRWVRDRINVAPTTPIPKIRKKNAVCLRRAHPDFDEAKHAFVRGKVNADRQAGAAHRLGRRPPRLVSPLNAVPKNSLKEPYRVIGNMRELIRYFPGWRMRFDDLRMFRHTMRPNYFCWSLDQHAAYHTILAQYPQLRLSQLRLAITTVAFASHLRRSCGGQNRKSV